MSNMKYETGRELRVFRLNALYALLRVMMFPLDTAFACQRLT